MATISQFYLFPSNPTQHNSDPRKLRITYCLAFKETSNQDENVEKWRDHLRVMFAAGGTGDHIYPAIAIADKVLVAFHSTVDSFVMKKKCVVCGNPVRLSLTQYVSRAVTRTHFFPRLGGSLGANAINIALLNLYYELLERKDLFIIWQTGVEAFDEMESLVKSHPNVILTT